MLQTYVVNFICQKVQNFWADSDYLGKISDKKNLIFKFFFFQCLALPKDPQSFCPYVVQAKKNVFGIFQKKFLLYSNYARISHNFFFQKNSIGSG